MYATVQDLIESSSLEELIDRTDVDGTGTYDASAVGTALANGWGDVETYLLERYPEFTDGSTPLADVPRKLISLQCDMARARLWDDAENKVVSDNKAAAVRFLERVADGKQLLRRPVRQTTPQASGGVEISRGRNAYSDGSLTRFRGL